MKFNLNTPKFHSFGDYAAYVEMGVTLDSVTTGYVSRHLEASAGGKIDFLITVRVQPRWSEEFI